MNAVVDIKPAYYAIPPAVVELPSGQFVIGIEKMANVREEIAPLHALHWREVEQGHTPLRMKVAYHDYENFEKQGQFILFTVRSTFLVGYFMCYMHRANHANDELVAREDALFMMKHCRGTGVANHLMNYVEAALKGFGCKTLSLSSRHPAGGADLTPWMKRRKYKPSAVVFVKEL